MTNLWPWLPRRRTAGLEATEREQAAAELHKLQLSLAPLMEEGELRSLLVSSAAHFEGRTTLAVSLARTLVETAARRVLLVDADTRRPALHRVFHCGRERGFAEVVRQKVALAEAIHRLTPEGLFLLPAGRPGWRWSDVFALEALERFVSEATGEFDLVLFDAAPLLLSAEALRLSRCVDGVLWIVLAGQTQGGVLRRAQHALERAQAKVLGVVINNYRQAFEE